MKSHHVGPLTWSCWHCRHDSPHPFAVCSRPVACVHTGRPLRELLSGTIVPFLAQSGVQHVRTVDKGPAVVAASFRLQNGQTFDVEVCTGIFHHSH